MFARNRMKKNNWTRFIFYYWFYWPFSVQNNANWLKNKFLLLFLLHYCGIKDIELELNTE